MNGRIDDMTDATTTVAERVHALAPTLLELSHAIHDDPELSWAEHRAAERVAVLLEQHGFAVTRGAYGLPTALEAEYGSGDFTVAVCAEYDALPGVGHACGHNIIATAGVGAALALAAVADELGIRVKLLGTPAEEHGGGKVVMLREGAWEDATISVMTHPGQLDAHASTWTAQALYRFDVTFTGKASHAAAAPYEGVNAGDAATIALVAIGLLRQQVLPENRMNAYVIEAGNATNIIPERAVVGCEVRAFTMPELAKLKERVLRCFEAAALATGCEWSYERTEELLATLEQDPTMSDLFAERIAAIGRRLADPAEVRPGGSTDMGNVSQVLPSIHPGIGVVGAQNPPHTHGFAADAASPAGDQACLDGAIALAQTVAAVAADAELRAHYLQLQAAREAGATTRGIEL